MSNAFETMRAALERIADHRDTHFSGDAQAVAREALAVVQQGVQPAEITLNGWQLLAALRHANPSLSFNAEEMESEIVISTRPLIDPMNNAKLCDGPIAWVDGVDESAIPLEDSEENSAYGQIPTTQGLDALRWQVVHDHTGGEYIAGRACFVVHIPALPGANIMRGSVAEHFTKAVDAIAAQVKQGGA